MSECEGFHECGSVVFAKHPILVFKYELTSVEEKLEESQGLLPAINISLLVLLIRKNKKRSEKLSLK